MFIPSEVLISILLWIFLSILTKMYLIKRNFGFATILACLLLAMIFVGTMMITSGILGYLGLEISMLPFIVATWILFIAARGLLVTEKITTRENVLFGSLVLTYVVFYIIMLIQALISG